MDLKVVAKIAVDKLVYSVDKLYDYIVLDEQLNKVKIGSRVLVPFGNGNKKRQAIIFELIKVQEEDTKKLKVISDVLDEELLLDDEMLQLAVYMKDKYYCTLFDAIKCMVPSGSNIKTIDSYYLENNFEISNCNLNEDQKKIINYLKLAEKPVASKKIIKDCNLCDDIQLKKMLKIDVIKKIETALQKVLDAKVKMIKLRPNVIITDFKLTEKQKSVFGALLNVDDGLSIKEIQYLTGISQSVVESLLKKKIVQSFDNTVYRDPYKNISFNLDDKKINLTEEQQLAYRALYEKYKANKYEVSLLYGVTGSGKTSVFMKLIDDVHKEGRGVIVMVPEIALTPQMVAIFKSRFQDKVAVIHSGLSAGERFDEFKRIRASTANIVVGTRSAVFCPLKNIGLIIMDEEQEYTYKSDASPRYHAREIAKFRCSYHKSLLLLSSATPSIESFYLAKNQKYSLNKLENRYGNAKLPKVTIVDMNLETQNGNFSSFSSTLTEQLDENLQKGHQSILLLNRRGYNTFVSCRSCGEVVTCPNCSISMTYHSANSRLMCHYCGYSLKTTDDCPNCHEKGIKYSGVGTQKVEEDLKRLFPKAGVLRMDTDTTMAKFSYEQKLKDFSSGNYDIMLGTQMVAKGLDFPNVTLVGVLSVDQTLYNDDFRSYERAFSLLTQVVGRSGRADKEGKAVIQTFTPENSIIRFAAKQNYEPFFSSEIELRKAMLYPPFSNICVVGFVGANEKKVVLAAKDFFGQLKQASQKDYSSMPLRVLGPSPAKVLKVSNKYRYKIIIKYKNEKNFREFMKTLLSEFNNNGTYFGVNLFVDINPDMII
ncbi:MAG: primosomal protein N' [Eubacteriales bacterium SKADARSKE-1]|nr:primosomal protein N' [Eubacteriales bacterium SKADARSKE-1]